MDSNPQIPCTAAVCLQVAPVGHTVAHVCERCHVFRYCCHECCIGDQQRHASECKEVSDKCSTLINEFHEAFNIKLGRRGPVDAETVRHNTQVYVRQQIVHERLYKQASTMSRVRATARQQGTYRGYVAVIMVHRVSSGVGTSVRVKLFATTAADGSDTSGRGIGYNRPTDPPGYYSPNLTARTVGRN